MGDATGIEWTNATVNFWWGCTKVGPGCDHCYAETWSGRFGESLWGVGAPRRKIKGAAALLHRLDNNYAEWAADATCRVENAKVFGLPVPNLDTTRRVFIQSMSDLFDLEVELAWFDEAWQHIEACRRLSLQIVTKRISAVEKRLAAIGRSTWPKHAGLIVTVVDQKEADRDIPRFIELKKRLGIPWIGLSIEPMLGPIDLTPWLADLDWVICGGESGSAARPLHPDWVRGLRDQCTAAGAAFFFKQWGEFSAALEPGTAVNLDHLPKSDSVAWGDGETCHLRYRRIGKKAAGRLLDGVEHNAMPEVRHG